MRRLSSALVFALALTALTTASRRVHAEGDRSLDACASAAELAQLKRAEGKFLETRKALLACADGRCPSVVQHDCLPWLTEIETAIPSVLLRFRDDDGNDIGGVDVLIDGRSLALRPGLPVELDPGEHTLTAQRGQRRTTVRVTLLEGEKRRKIDFVLPRQEILNPKRSVLLPWAVLGAGVTTLAASGVLFFDAKADRESLLERCRGTCPAGTADSLRTRAVIVDITLIAGLAFSGAGVWLLFRPAPAPVDATLHAMRPRALW